MSAGEPAPGEVTAVNRPTLTPVADTVFVLRGIRHIITAVTPKSVRYRAAQPPPGFLTATPYTTTPGAFDSLVQAGLITPDDQHGRPEKGVTHG